jgi:hypothetical protein
MSVVSIIVGLLAFVKAHYFITGLLILATRLAFIRYFHPLSKIPGPFLASFSKLWIIYHAFGGKQHLVQIKCHEKYGMCQERGSLFFQEFN